MEPKIRGILIESTKWSGKKHILITTAHKKNEYKFFTAVHENLPIPDIIGMTWIDAYEFICDKNKTFTDLDALISPKHSFTFDYDGISKHDDHIDALRTSVMYGTSVIKSDQVDVLSMKDITC